jgi:hypothetical protein
MSSYYTVVKELRMKMFRKHVMKWYFFLKKTQTIFVGFDEYNVYNVYIVLNYQAL